MSIYINKYIHLYNAFKIIIINKNKKKRIFILDSVDNLFHD